MTAHIPHTGYYRRALRALSEHLGTTATLEAILARRRVLGREMAPRALAAKRVMALLVDTGYPPDAMPLSEMRRLLSCGIFEVFRIETFAESLLSQALPCDEFLDAFRQGLRAAADHCVALKTIIAYRSGLAIQAWKAEEVDDAYDQAIARRQSGGSPRLTQKPLLDALLNEALDVSKASGLPLQVHTGFGDPDIDLLRANPLLLRPILEDPRWKAIRIILLHAAYPYFREAAYLAAIWPHVYVDLSLMFPFLGPGSTPPLIEMLSLAPAGKLLYGSDVGGLPELYALSADWARAALCEALTWLVDRTGLNSTEARVMGQQILSENAQALYSLPPA